ncbi:hypothetical protein, partial [Microbulbifer sp. TYP-18]|uniref:hypothetical protein n=1 Tax=Microbulbifer sp. TYP-18 TaxID=3230024 RepID=UPI0034C6D777
MNKKSKIKLMALSSLFISNYIFASGPPEVPFQSLFVEGEYSTAYPSNRIYANGRMQAEVDIFYQLKDGYTFIGAELKELYSGQSFENTVISDGYNGYTKDIRLGSGTPASTSLPLTSSSTSTLSTTQVVRKYLSSSSTGIIQVCVEAQARNNVTNDIITQSTCEGTTNNASISIEKLSPTNFSLSNFIASSADGDWTDDWIIWAYTYQPQGFTLRRVWDENGLRLNQNQTDFFVDSGINYAPYKLLASYHPDRPNQPAQAHLNGSSSLYWIENGVVTSRLEFPYHDLTNYTYQPPGPLYIKHPFDYNFNTNENITFVVTYGGIYKGDYRTASRNYANMGYLFPGVIREGFFTDLE